LEFREAVRLRHAETAGKIAQTLRRVATPAHPANGRHSGIIPAFYHALLHKLQQPALAQYCISQAQPVELELLRMEDAELIEIPVIEWPMIFKLQGTYRVGDAFNGIALTMRPVVHGINAPAIARAMMLGVQDSVHDGIPHVEVRRRHVDFGAQGARAVRKLPFLHAREEVQIILDASIPMGTVLPWLGQRAPRLSHLVAAQIANEGFTLLDEVEGPIVELLEVVRCV